MTIKRQEITPYLYPAKANAAMQAMLQMGKLDIAKLQQACDGA